MQEKSHGAPLPAVSNRLWYPVISCKGRVPLLTTMLARQFLGMWCHWEGMPLPCYNRPDCLRCKRGMGIRWYGYVAVYCHHPWGDYLREPGRAVQALSEGAARQLLPIQRKYGHLRGVSIEVKKRDLDRVNSPYVVTETKRYEEGSLWEEHDILPSINRMLGMNEDFLQRQWAVIKRGHAGTLNTGVPIPGDYDEQYAGRQNQPTKEQVNQFRQNNEDFGKME